MANMAIWKGPTPVPFGFGGPRIYGGGPYHDPTRREEEGGKPRPLVVQGILVVSAVLIAGLVLFGSLQLGFVSRQGPYPQNAVQQFCHALVARDYATAWNLVDPDALGEENQFLQANQARDTQIGPVSRCVVVGRNYFATLNLSEAAFEVAVTLPDGRHQGTIMLRAGEHDWRITYIASDLSLRL